jgi:DNA-binding HxlR family transcriptional regulator
MKDHHGCPVPATINVLSGKWKVQILWHLSFGPRRFAQIRRKLPKISENVLTEQLRQLEKGRFAAPHRLANGPATSHLFTERRRAETGAVDGNALRVGLAPTLT